MYNKHPIHKINLTNETKYFVPFAKNGIKYRGIAFGWGGLDRNLPCIMLDAEFRLETVDGTPVVGYVGDNELVDFLISKTKGTDQNYVGN